MKTLFLSIYSYISIYPFPLPSSQKYENYCLFVRSDPAVKTMSEGIDVGNISQGFLNPPSLESFGFTPLKCMSPNTKPSDVLTLCRNNICLDSDSSTFDFELISVMLGPGTPDEDGYDSPDENYVVPNNRDCDRIGCTVYEGWPRDPTTKSPPKYCKECSMVHSPSELCFGESCNVCYSKCHYFCSCPYLDYIPQGADFDSEAYVVHCQCGYPFFDTATWTCPAKRCGGVVAARLCPKECDICETTYEHTTYECTKDEVVAASHREFIKNYFVNCNVILGYCRE